MNNKQAEVRELAEFCLGAASVSPTPLAEKLREAGYWLKKLSNNMCGAGIIGCKGGPNCTSSHK